MMRIILSTTLALSFSGLLGCSFIARGPDRYRADTREVLEQNSAALKSCYDGVIAADKAATGHVVVRFTVMAETGEITGAVVDEGGSTAPAAVQQCVVKGLDGLALMPADARDGNATFTYEFEIAPQAQAAPKS